MFDSLTIVPLSRENFQDVNRANQAFDVIGRLIPCLRRGQWSFTEELFPESYPKTYEDDSEDFFTQHMDVLDKAAYLAYLDGQCVGQLVLKADWNGYCFIEDICVARDCRGRGVGSALIEKAKDWAKERELSGLALETQDNNLLACRFYQRQGFQLGGVNTLFYRNFHNPETALFWYLLF